MPYDEENVLTGERAYQVLRELAMSEEGSYSTEIAENIGTTQQVVSEIISVFKELNLVEKGKRTQAQYYKVDITGFSSLFWRFVEEEILEGSLADRESIESALKSEVKLYEEFSDYSMDKALRRDFPKFLNFYAADYLANVEDSTIKEMIYEDFLEGVLTYESGQKELPGWFYAVKAIARKKYDFLKDPSSMVSSALMSYEELPDTIEKKHTYYLVPHDPEDNVAWYDLDKKGDHYICKKCGKEVEEFEVGEESPCGCGIIETEESITESFEPGNIDLEGAVSNPTDLSKEQDQDDFSIRDVLSTFKNALSLRKQVNELPEELQTELVEEYKRINQEGNQEV